MADANSAYTLADADHLRKLDDFYLMMIEQPLGHDDIIDHAELQARLQTPICLDECIRTRAPRRAGHPAARLRHHQHQAGPRGRLRRSAARARRGAGGRHSGVVRRHAGSRHRPRAQRGAGHAAQFRAARRRLGQPALLEARHHPAGGRDHPARHHRDPRRAGLRLRARSRFHPPASRCARSPSVERFLLAPRREPQLPLHLGRPGGERDRRPLQQHRRVQPGGGGHPLRAGGERRDALARRFPPC